MSMAHVGLQRLRAATGAVSRPDDVADRSDATAAWADAFWRRPRALFEYQVSEFDRGRLVAAWQQAVFDLYLAEDKIEPEVDVGMPVQEFAVRLDRSDHAGQSAWKG